MNWEAVALTARLAVSTSLILLLVGMPVAWWLAFTRWRWKPLAESVVALPLVLPPTVLGFYILVALGPSSPAGRLYEAVTHSRLPFSFEGLLLASVLYSLPFAVQPFAAALAGVDRRLLEASWACGAGTWTTLRRVAAPIAAPGILTGIVLSFAHTVGEFGVVLMVGGNIPGVTRTVSIDVYDKVQQLDYEGAGVTALFLLAVSYGLLVVVYSVNRAAGRPGGLLTRNAQQLRPVPEEGSPDR